jgi:hypothetical protein
MCTLTITAEKMLMMQRMMNISLSSGPITKAMAPKKRVRHIEILPASLNCS